MVLRHKGKDKPKDKDRPRATTTTKPPKRPKPRPREPKTTTTTTTTTTTARPRPVVGVPTGPIQTPGFAGTSWDAVTQYDGLIHAAADPVGWPAERVRAHILIESGGNPRAVQANESNGYSYGLMQIVPFGVGWAGWHELVKETAGLSVNAPASQVINALYDPRINIAVGVQILESLYQQYGSLDKASSAFFLGNPDWRGADTVNGNTGTWYRDTLNALIAEQRGSTGTTAAPSADVVSVILGGAPTDDSYGFKHPTDLPYYAYFEGHGGTRYQHTGIDATTAPGQPLFSPIAGTVVCGGTGNGPGVNGTGCAVFPDEMGRGAGRVEILAADGRRSLILGHVSRALVSPGQHVVAGQQVAEAGGMNGWHVHIEARDWNGGDYTIVDPRALFGGAGGTRYAQRVDVPQPDPHPPVYQVRARRGGAPIHQRADPTSPKVDEDLADGETFLASYRAPGADGKEWWIGVNRGRVPVDATDLVQIVT